MHSGLQGNVCSTYLPAVDFDFTITFVYIAHQAYRSPGGGFRKVEKCQLSSFSISGQIKNASQLISQNRIGGNVEQPCNLIGTDFVGFVEQSCQLQPLY